jgi:hypothetical protein
LFQTTAVAVNNRQLKRWFLATTISNGGHGIVLKKNKQAFIFVKRPPG